MKSNALVSLLCLAPVALAAPVPIVLVQGLDPVRPQLAKAAVAPPAQPQRAPSRGDGEQVPVALDSRPATGSSAGSPSTVLSWGRPLPTTYLMSLAKTKSPKTPGPPAAGGVHAMEELDLVVVDTTAVPKSALEAVQSSTTAQLEMGIRHSTKRIGIPCYLAHLRRDYTDMLAITLVATFLLIIVVVETWDAMYQR